MTASSRPLRHAGHQNTRRAARHPLAVVAACALVASALLTGCAPGAHSHHLTSDDPPAALHAEPSADAAGEVAIYVLGLYSEEVSEGDPRPDPSLELQPGWDDTLDFEMVATEYLVGGTVEGGSFLEANVASAIETGRREYEVTLKAQREAQAFRAPTGALVVRLPAGELRPVITLTHLGTGWRVDRLLLDPSDAER